MKSLILFTCMALGFISTECDAADYMIGCTSAGIAVSRLVGSKAIPVKGSPFQFSVGCRQIVTSPNGQYFYDTFLGDQGQLGIASFSLSESGVPTLVSTLSDIAGADHFSFQMMLAASSNAVYIMTISIGNAPSIELIDTSGGALKVGSEGFFGFFSLGTAAYTQGISQPLTFQVDPAGRFATVTYYAYQNLNPYGSCTQGSCIAVFDLQNVPSVLNAVAPLVFMGPGGQTQAFDGRTRHREDDMPTPESE
jgi:hypothetical protein